MFILVRVMLVVEEDVDDSESPPFLVVEAPAPPGYLGPRIPDPNYLGRHVKI